MYQQLIAILNLVKLKISKDILGSSKCKVSFGFKYRRSENESRAVLQLLTKEGAKAKEIHGSMPDVYGDS